MALIYCQECGKQVSDRAAACPHCGAPQTIRRPPKIPTAVYVENLPPQKPPKARMSGCQIALITIAGVIVGGFALLFILALLMGKDDNSSSHATTGHTNVASAPVEDQNLKSASAALSNLLPDIHVDTNADAEFYQARGVAVEMQDKIKVLADFTDTGVFPSRGTNGGWSFVILTEQPVFEVPESKKAWLLIVVAEVGSEFNNHPQYRGDSLCLSDFENAKRGQCWTITISNACSLQRSVYLGEIHVDEMYSSILADLSPYKAAPRK